MSAPTAIDRMRSTLAERVLAGPDTPALLMVSGGSDHNICFWEISLQ